MEFNSVFKELNTYVYYQLPFTCFGVCYTNLRVIIAVLIQKLYVLCNVVTNEGWSKIFLTDAVKNHKTYHKTYRSPSPSKQFPPACRHRSHRLPHFWKAFWKSFSVRVSSTFCVSAWISSMVSNRHPFSFNFILRNRKKSQGAKSGDYGGWRIRTILFYARNWWVRTAVWYGALS